MSLGNFIRDAITGSDGYVDNVLGSGHAKVADVVGFQKARGVVFARLFDGGFAGLSDSGIETLKGVLKQYVADLQEKIGEFDETANISDAFKGNIQEAAKGFISATKELLSAYVSTLKVNLDELDKAVAAYKESSEELSQNITSDADSIRSNANSIKID